MEQRPSTTVRYTALLAILLALLTLESSVSVWAQDFFFRRTQLSDAVQVDEAPNNTLAHLERIDAFIGDQQWNEVVDALNRVTAESGDKLLPLTVTSDARDDLDQPGGSRRYVPVSLWCQMRLAMTSQNAPEVLKLYRSQVDPLAKSWFDQSKDTHDEVLLKRIVNELFCSSYGDDALLTLGEIALERGQPATARAYWQRISPQLRAGKIPLVDVTDVRIEEQADEEQVTLASGLRTSNGRPLWMEHQLHPELEVAKFAEGGELSYAFPAYPDTDLNLADVRARLVLASILAGASSRAEFELQLLGELHPDAQGTLSGKQVNYQAALTALLEESRDWTQTPKNPNWPTFANNVERNAISRTRIDVAGTPAWSFPLGERLAIDESSFVSSGIGRRIAETSKGLLSFHPIVVDDIVLITDVIPSPQERDYPHWITRVRAYDLNSGQPAWPKRRRGEVQDEGVVQQSRPFAVRYTDRSRWGVPRFTMSSHGRYLFARLGSPVTSGPRDDLPIEGHDQIVVMDLAQQGKMLWSPIEPEDDFAFEGPPISDGDGLYIAMRRTLSQPQAYVAAFDLKTGQPRWKTWLSAAESPALGRSEEVTHNLLTLHDEVLYCNTNLGAVAAVDAASGKVQWLTAYQRANFDPEKNGEPATNFQRDLHPCLYWRGLLLVAPSDCHDLLCLEASTGQLLWSVPARDIVHLLGVTDEGKLLASGNRLWWIDVETGRITARFP